jgi:hypothetical protein
MRIAVLPERSGAGVARQDHGRVNDQSGGVIPGAEVKVTNLATNVVAAVVTNSAGSFNVPFLLPGE